MNEKYPNEVCIDKDKLAEHLSNIKFNAKILREMSENGQFGNRRIPKLEVIADEILESVEKIKKSIER